MHMNIKPLIIESVYDVSVEKVWEALTQNEQLKEWYFQLDEFKPKFGFKFDFIGGTDEGPRYLHFCEIVDVVAHHQITYTWKYDNYPGNSTVKWEIFPTDKGTRVQLTHTGIESFEENGKDFTRESFKAGWTYFLHEALKKFLEP